MGTSEKLVTIAENIPKVYKSGQASMVDETKIIKKTVSGESVMLDDVSEIPHKIEVKLSSGGKNLWEHGDVNDLTEISGGKKVKLLSGITYTFSALVTSTDVERTTCLVYDTTNAVFLGQINRDVRSSITFTPTKQVNEIRLYASDRQATSVGDTATFKDIMIEENDTVTEYEPYKETLTDYSNVAVSVGTNESEITQILTVNTDGTVEGVKSTSPYMYMTTDNQNVTINATYHKSYGMQTEYDRFWDTYQDEGNRTDYTNAFSGIGWVNEIFKPKYPIDSPLKYNQLFRFAFITHINYDLNLTKMTNANLVFDSCTKLVKIQKIITNENVTYTQWFGWCIALETIAFDGIIGKSIDFQYSTKLTKASILNILNALSPTITGQTLTLSKTAVTNAFGSTTATEWTNLVATKTNWTISLV